MRPSRTWDHGNCLSMTPADRIFDLVIDKGDMDCVVCSSYQIERRMNMYRDEVGRFLRLKLEDEDGNSDNTKGEEGKGGTTTTPSTAKNATKTDKKKSATTTAAKKNKKNKKPPP